MYLKRLELQGFKSFADKTILEFKPGITSVIGPNGSGKSNISDAIRWVLGEQSIKELRGGKTSDIIFAGTENRRSLGFAEATLVFDNSDSKLPIEFQEVTVTRKVFRSGETGYYINKVQCRLKDILELFMDTGIGKDGYSIIGQGKIDEILSNKSEDRRNVFEEAAGIVKYKARKQESEKKLEHTKLNIMRINDIISEIEGNLEPLKMQADKAKKYVDLKAELKNEEVGLFLYNIQKCKEDLLKINENIDIMQSNCNLEEGKLEKIKILKDELKSTIDELTEKIESTQNLEFTNRRDIDSLNSLINVIKSKIENNENNKTRFYGDIEDLKEKINNLKEDIDSKFSKKDRLKINKEKYEQQLNQKAQELEKISQNLSEKEVENENNKRLLEEIINQKFEIDISINEKKSNILNLEKRENELNNELRNNISDLDNNSFNKEDIEKSVYQIQKQKNDLYKIIDDKKNININLENRLKTIDIQINNNLKELNFKESKHNFLLEAEKEKDGYQKSVKVLLKDCEESKELRKGVKGVLAELIDVPQKLSLAIEMALASSIQNIVTETEEDAKRLINYLRDNKLGRASFLPISSIKGKKIDSFKGSKDGVLGIAADLIKFNKEYENIIFNLLGRTVITNNIDTAIRLSKENLNSFRIVTLDGDIINTTGSMSGGSVSNKTGKILGRAKEIEDLKKCILEIKNKQLILAEQKKEILSEISNWAIEREKLDKNYQNIEIQYNVEMEKLNGVLENMNKISIHIEKIKQEQNNILMRKKEYSNFLDEDIAKREDFEKQSEILRKKIEDFSSVNRNNQKMIDDLNYDITNLKISVSSFDESENSINEMIDILQKELENYNNDILNKQNEIEKINNDKILFENNIEDLNKKIEDLKINVQGSIDSIQKMKNQRQDANQKISLKEKEELEEFSIIENLKAQIVKLDVKKTKIDDELNNVIQSLWNEYELTPNTCDGYKKPENVAITTRKVNSLRQDIRELGSVNVDSIEEYKNQKQRYDFMCEQRLDMENTMSKLRDMISEITNNMKVRFKEKIKIINDNFGETFKELFGGGVAKIVLEDETNILECGINIEVQPPGKKLQSMALLSGGERAFTAIALLFAILKMNPAPFCVLDEIEAALDDVNVSRYAEFLKKFSIGTQFLVITHRKGTMEAADTVYGITMEEKGISKLLSMKLRNV